MEFGKLDTEDLNTVDFRLPPDNPATTRLLASLAPGATTKFFIGCAKWGRKDWVGKIYPPKTKEADFLDHYGRHFNSIELNATFYRMPSVARTAEWAAKVNPEFKFSPKFPNQITHMRRLKNVEEPTDRFLKAVSGFGSTLGPLFLMPHPGMGAKDLERIDAFLGYLPKDVQTVVELRHPEWFSDESISQSLFAVLEKHGAGTVITDASGRRDCLHMRLTTPDAFIRFVGNDLHPTDYTRIDEWVNRIKAWKHAGIRNVYFFMHQNEEVHSPEAAKYLIQQLNLHCGAAVPEPKFVDPLTVESEAVSKKKGTVPKGKKQQG
ncbi:MAG: DUF72 domain-containing protein [Chryseolinea sp.]